MKYFSSQYIITNCGAPLKRALITTTDDGTILDIKDTNGNLEEKHSLEFYNGIIIPGFVNCHCHLELSHMKDSVIRGCGLSEFVAMVRNTRENSDETIINSAYSADNDLYNEGVVLCADICNTSLSFDIKSKSKISYINLLEVFGIDSAKAGKRLDEIMKVAEKAEELKLPYDIVPHSVYSTSLPLFRLLRGKNENNKVTAIHFMETEGEKQFLEKHTGPLMASYEQSGLAPASLETVSSHIDAVMNEITSNGNLILVHNTFIDKKTIKGVQKRNNLFWCLCPNSNLYIENKVPPLDLLKEEGCEIVTGTDSLASNNRLSILEELKTLQLYFHSLSIGEMITWATLNGARALGKDDLFGKIETGKKPGLLLLQNVDLQNMKLLPESYVTRLI
jgi:aminodeoxyfutalosine deaminase